MIPPVLQRYRLDLAMIVAQGKQSSARLKGGCLRIVTSFSPLAAMAREISPFPKGAVFALAGLFGLTLSTATQDANANGETRSLSMVHSHTGESLSITYKRNGSFDSAALEKLNWFLRDWRVDEPTSMAPQLFDVIWHVYREVGADEPIKIMSAYRSPGTNAMLRRRSRAVAKESQHMRGNAMDIHIPGVSMGKAREIGMRLQAGGVGYYPSAGSPFVHLDVGSVRSWPRMPREQLERLFPDGKTVHLPADGIPLANYQVALAEVQARGGSALDYETVTTNRGKSLWALLFGSETDEDAGEIQPRGGRQVARGRNGRQPVEVASAAPQSFDDGGSPWKLLAAQNRTAAPVSPPPRGPVLAMAEPEPAKPVAPPAVARAVVSEKVEPPPLQIAALPVPPIRPRGAQLDKLIAATDPLPPIRPQGLSAFPPQMTAPEPPAAQQVALVPAPGAPVPPSRPVQIAALPSAEPVSPAIPAAAEPPKPVAAPLPPLRPTLEASVNAVAASALPSFMAKPEPVAPAVAMVQAYAAIAAPLPPARPGAPPRAAAATTALPAPAVAAAAAVASTPSPRPKAVQVQAENVVTARPAVVARPAQVQAVAEPPVAREIRSGVVAMKLTQEKAAVPGGFSGGFVRPLGASFTKSGE